LILNKIDLLPESERIIRCADVVKKLKWNGPVRYISALGSLGTEVLCQDIMYRLEECWDDEKGDPNAAAHELDLQSKMQLEAKERIELLKKRQIPASDDDIEVIHSN